MDKRATAWLFCWWSVGCTTLLGIEDDYRARDVELGGGAGSGASGGSDGGVGASGGTGGKDASVSDGAGGGCAVGEKYCNGCFPPTPAIGCSRDGCEPCPAAPDNAVADCDAGSCVFICIDGYQRSDGGDGCVPNASDDGGGQDGSGGSGGSPPNDAGACNPVVCPADGGCAECRGCLAPVPAPGCCLANGKCGGFVFGCFECLIGAP